MESAVRYPIACEKEIWLYKMAVYPMPWKELSQLCGLAATLCLGMSAARMKEAA